MRYDRAMIPNTASFRLVITLPSGVIVYRVADIEWRKDEMLPLVESMRPLFEWAVEELEPWMPARAVPSAAGDPE